MILQNRIIRIALFLFSLLLSNQVLAQIQGQIFNAENEALPFATIHIEGTTHGVNSNEDGFYEIRPREKGVTVLIVQYIGYTTTKINVDYFGQKITKNIVLNPAPITIPTIELSANREDPAYPIIRAAMKMRKKHLAFTDAYSARSYIKGIFSLDKVPNGLIKNEILKESGDAGLDSAGRGILYLSESKSTFHKQRPSNTKEVIEKFKVSGFDIPYTFNNAESMSFSLYEKTLELGISVVSPIAKNAFAHYKYRLEGTNYDNKGRVLNIIFIEPKNKSSAAFTGHLYITDDIWNIQQSELFITKHQLSTDMIDTMTLRQVAIETTDNKWVDIKKEIYMDISLMGFKASGGFYGVFTDFELDKKFDEDFFGPEIYKIEKNAKVDDINYWDSIRPIPLLEKELDNYTLQDSLKIKRQEKRAHFLKNQPKFKVLSALMGYNKYSIDGNHQFLYGSPLMRASYNTVQGYNGTMSFAYDSWRDSLSHPRTLVGLSVNVGFPEKSIRPLLNLLHQSRDENFTSYEFQIGRDISQFDLSEPIPRNLNSLLSLFSDHNYAKYYEKDFVKLGLKRELNNGIDFYAYAEFARRHALVNHEKSSYTPKDKNYSSNDPLYSENRFIKSFVDNNNVKVGLQFRFRFKQKIISLPDQKIRISSKYPTVHTRLEMNRNLSDNRSFLKGQLSIADFYNFKLKGSGYWKIGAGKQFINKTNEFVDYFHFDGNETFLVNANRTLQFLALPYYKHSSNDAYLTASMKHNFGGFIMNKIPLIRKLKWHLSTGANILYAPDGKEYGEVFLGLENIGISIFRILTANVVWSQNQNGYRGAKFVVGTQMGLNQVNNEKQINVYKFP